MFQRKKAAIATPAEKSICLVQPFRIYINNNNKSFKKEAQLNLQHSDNNAAFAPSLGLEPS